MGVLAKKAVVAAVTALAAMAAVAAAIVAALVKIGTIVVACESRTVFAVAPKFVAECRGGAGAGGGATPFVASEISSRRLRSLTVEGTCRQPLDLSVLQRLSRISL